MFCNNYNANLRVVSFVPNGRKKQKNVDTLKRRRKFPVDVFHQTSVARYESTSMPNPQGCAPIHGQRSSY